MTISDSILESLIINSFRRAVKVTILVYWPLKRGYYRSHLSNTTLRLILLSTEVSDKSSTISLGLVWISRANTRINDCSVDGILVLYIFCTTENRMSVSISGWILWKIWMMKLPRQTAACSFVWGDSRCWATFIISSVFTSNFISWWPTKMKFLRAVVPWRSKNMSSDFLTKLRSLGKIETIFLKSSECSSLSVFFSRVLNKSSTCYNIVESTTLITFWS